MHCSNSAPFDHLVGADEQFWSHDQHRRHLFFPRLLVEHAQHGERHGLNPGLDGRLGHRREQGRVVARQLRTFALAGGSERSGS